MNNPEIFKTKEYHANMVVINSDTATLSKTEQAKLRALVAEFQDIFAGKNTLPKPMTDQPPVHFVAKEGTEPTRCPKPRWGPSQERLLQKWAQAALASGLIEPAGPNCPYANRPHVVEKPDYDARVTGDFVRLNEGLIKMPCNLPNMEDELRKHRGAKLFTVTDTGIRRRIAPDVRVVDTTRPNGPHQTLAGTKERRQPLPSRSYNSDWYDARRGKGEHVQLHGRFPHEWKRFRQIFRTHSRVVQDVSSERHHFKPSKNQARIHIR